MDNFVWTFATVIVTGFFPLFLTLKFILNYLRQYIFNN